MANEPFFGRAGRLMANNQRDQNPEIRASHSGDLTGQQDGLHELQLSPDDAFGQKWGLTLADGSTAFTACVGFGLERIALALFAQHVLDVAQWPEHVRNTLWG